MPKSHYWYCPNCHGNFDPGEKCDCETEGRDAQQDSSTDILSHSSRTGEANRSDLAEWEKLSSNPTYEQRPSDIHSS
jgi:hypothetical protein